MQYDHFEWQFFRFEKFEVYFYKGGQDLAKYAAKYLNRQIPQIEKKLDFYLDERVQLIIYNKQSHFQQSNIGLSTDELYNIGGVTQIVGNKLFVYFEGDFAELNQQLDKGLAKVLIYQMMYGGNWRDVLKNSTLLRLPDWYLDGFLSYLSEAEDPYIHSRIKDGIQSGLYDKFNKLQGEEAVIAGHAMWNYIADTYGENVFSNILYMTRITRDINDGFLFVIGVTFKQFSEDWLAYYKNLYNSQSRAINTTVDPLPVKVKKNRSYQSLVADPSGNYVAYSSNHQGQLRIFIYDIKNKKRNKIIKKGHKLERLIDYSYPILDWHPTGKALSFVMEEKGELLLYTYYTENEAMDIQPLFGLEKVLSLDYSDEGANIVFSGVYEGQSDLYLYNIVGNTQKKLIDDPYDDLQAVFINNSTQIAFISNRTLTDSITVLPESKDVFVYDLKSGSITRVSDSPEISESYPMQINEAISYLAPNGRLQERYMAKFDSSINRIDTIIHYDYFYKTELMDSYDRSILEQYSNSDDTFTEIIYRDRRYSLFLNKNQPSQALQIMDSPGPDSLTLFRLDENATLLKSSLPDPAFNNQIDFTEYTFYNSQKTKQSHEETVKEEKTEIAEVKELEFPTQRLYRLNFKPDNSILQLNNTFLNRKYQNFNGGPYINAGFGASARIGIVDLMEDYRIYGGFRYSGDLIEYSVTFQDLSKRLDKEYSFSRTRQRFLTTSVPQDVKSIQILYSLKYPFSEVSSLRAGLSMRNDKLIPLSADLTTLRDSSIANEYWATAKLAYVFDNTRNVALNIRYGLRFKIFAEHYQKLYSQSEFDKGGDLTVVGFDLRHYQKIHREFIWVNRFAASSSFGSHKLIYYLGGVDDWFKSSIFNYETDIDFNQNYRYQALAANMRGFLQNIRNGTSFAVINSELRLPVFNFFIQRPIQSDFVRNFQIIGFGDIGTAWVGSNPYSDENTSNHRIISRKSITVILEDVNDPLVGGVGFGLRTTLLGYFVRADWAWGIQNGEFNKDKIFYLSLSLDI